MAFRVFLDANVLISAFVEREDTEICVRLMEYIAGGRFKGFTSPAVLHICSFMLKKYYPKNELRSLLASLLQTVRVVEVNHQFALQALQSTIDDTEDALQYYAAWQHHLDIFISHDKRLKKAAFPALPVASVKEFYKNYTNEHE